jgi:hypothetical protein
MIESNHPVILRPAVVRAEGPPVLAGSEPDW